MITINISRKTFLFFLKNSFIYIKIIIICHIEFDWNQLEHIFHSSQALTFTLVDILLLT